MSRELLVATWEHVLEETRADRLILPHLGDPPNSPVVLLGAGKAAGWMAEAVEGKWRSRVQGGLIVCPRPRDHRSRLVRFISGGHPMPDQHSLTAGREVFEFAGTLPTDVHVIGLLSGGASAMMEHLRPGWTLKMLRQETKALMREGADITQLNAIRAEASLLKRGGLARVLNGRLKQVFILSDVHSSPLSVVGSGPFFDKAAPIPHALIGNDQTALQAATKFLSDAGFVVIQLPWIHTESREAGRAFAHAARELPPGTAMVATGEPTVTVLGDGEGGRASEFGAAAANEISGVERLFILAAGTDGRDGPTDSAGVIVDGGSLDRAGGVELALKTSDTLAWARKAGAVIPRRDTRTNVNDLFLAVRV